jgi:hypothetical protein
MIAQSQQMCNLAKCRLPDTLIVASSENHGTAAITFREPQCQPGMIPLHPFLGLQHIFSAMLRIAPVSTSLTASAGSTPQK